MITGMFSLDSKDLGPPFDCSLVYTFKSPLQIPCYEGSTTQAESRKTSCVAVEKLLDHVNIKTSQCMI